MKSKEKLIYLITKYKEGKYATSDFCDLFVKYHREMADEETLSEFSEKWIKDLAEICCRFSEAPEDFAIPNVYFSEKDITEYLKSYSIQLIY